MIRVDRDSVHITKPYLVNHQGNRPTVSRFIIFSLIRPLKPKFFMATIARFLNPSVGFFLSNVVLLYTFDKFSFEYLEKCWSLVTFSIIIFRTSSDYSQWNTRHFMLREFCGLFVYFKYFNKTSNDGAKDVYYHISNPQNNIKKMSPKVFHWLWHKNWVSLITELRPFMINDFYKMLKKTIF